MSYSKFIGQKLKCLYCGIHKQYEAIFAVDFMERHFPHFSVIFHLQLTGARTTHKQIGRAHSVGSRWALITFLLAIVCKVCTFHENTAQLLAQWEKVEVLQTFQEKIALKVFGVKDRKRES